MCPLSLIQENQASLKQQQQLLINLAMRQAFHVLQLPVLELSEWLKMEIEANPILEIDFAQEEQKVNLDDFERKPLRNRSLELMDQRRRTHQENLLTAPISLYEYLTRQISLAIADPEKARLAELIIGNLNEKGFLETALSEIEPSIPLEIKQNVLLQIQSFDPPGIAARNLQECLLLQLKIKGKGGGKAAAIIAHAFDDLVHNRLPRIAQKLKIPMPHLLRVIKREIAPLDLYPGYQFFNSSAAPLIPDLHFVCLEGKWHIEINTTLLPRFQVVPIYQQALKDASLQNEEASYIRRHLVSGRWLGKIIKRRNETLRRIGEFVLKRQIDFFEGEKVGFASMTIQEAATELSLHESTITRAISNKYAACPQGLFPMKTFFSQAIHTPNGRKISKHNVRKMLARTIENEDKINPLSDDEIARQFQSLGIPCARRTVSKYRNALKIAPAANRRKWEESTI